jgi:HAE1 family hydrophobic/amphiphilic exporter-1
MTIKKISSIPLHVWLTALALKRPVTTSMIMLSLFVTGLMASRLLPQESFPTLNIPMAFISVPYNGATPEEVERLITRPIEEALGTLSGVTEMISRSRADSANIQIMMKLSTDLDSKILEVREKVDMVRHLLPDDVQRVWIQKFSTEDIPVISIVLSGEQDLSHAYDFLERKIKRPIERLKGVGKVDFRGVTRPNIEIQLNSTKMAMNRVDQGQLLQDLRASNFLVRSGNILNGQRKYRVTPDGEYHSLNDIKNFQVKVGVKLKDIALVHMVSPERNSEIRTDRQKSVGMEVFKESDANVVSVTDEIVALVEKIKQQDEFKNIVIKIKDNSGEEIQKSLADLLKAGTFGILLSFGVLYIFLRNTQMTFIVVASVPVSLSFAIAGMYFMGYTLNMLTLAGLFIAVGLLIDNSVVICESILQQQQKSLSHVEKILKGVDNVSIAIISGTLTTTIVFMPLLMGEKNFITTLVEQIAVAICLPLFASLIIAKTAIPLMLSRVNQNDLNGVVTQGKLDAWYRPRLSKVLTNPKKTILGIFILIVSAVFARELVTNNVEAGKAEKEIFIRYHIQGEQKLADVSKVVDGMEQYLYDNKEAFQFRQVNSRIWPGFAMSRIKLIDNYSLPIHELKENIRKNFPQSAIARPSFDWSDQKQKLAKVTLNGSSTERLILLSEGVISQLANTKGFAEVGIDNNTNKLELLLRIDRDKVMRLGANTQDVAGRISTALRGVQLRSFRDRSLGETAIKLVYHPERVVPLSRIKQLPILENKGKIITLQQLVTFDSEPVMREIKRVRRRTSLTISINLEDISRAEAAIKIKEVMENIAFPSGYDWQLGNQFQQDQEAMKDMAMNMVLALALIFMVMAALFESLLMPIAILSSIGLAFIGVYWTFALLGLGLGETAMIGMLILMGIVVNNGIVLIDQINKLKGDSQSILEPIIEACVSRIRPIFMTVATTVIGMVPLALASSDNEAYPMAVAIIGGLLFSTFTSLFLVPFCYLMLVKLGERSVKRFNKAKEFADSKISLR